MGLGPQRLPWVGTVGPTSASPSVPGLTAAALQAWPLTTYQLGSHFRPLPSSSGIHSGPGFPAAPTNVHKLKTACWLVLWLCV